MSKPLISTWSLVSGSWSSFAKNWKTILKIAVWLLLPLAVFSLPALLEGYATGKEGTGSLVLLVFGLAYLVSILFSIHVVIRLLEFLLAQDRGQTLQTISVWKTTPFFLSYIWISILTGLAVGIGYVLLIVPGIWMGVALSMAPLLLLEDGKKGSQALFASIALIKGRWWGTLWRLIASSIILVIPFLVLAAVLFGLMTALMSTSFEVYFTFIQILAQLIFTPLMMIVQVKLFHALKDSR